MNAQIKITDYKVKQRLIQKKSHIDSTDFGGWEDKSLDLCCL